MFSRNKTFVALAAVVSLILARPYYMTMGNAGRDPVPSVRKVTLSDASGKPLRSLFAGVPSDPRFKRYLQLSALHSARSSCARKPTQVAHLLQLMGLSFDNVVYASPNCGDCGFHINQYYTCAEQCGGDAYDGELESGNSSDGIEVGSLTCTQGGCSGTVATDNCTCDSGY